jgi:hypothetical protein
MDVMSCGSQLLTDDESKKSNPSREALNHRFIQSRTQFPTHLVSEGNQGKGDEKENGE